MLANVRATGFDQMIKNVRSCQTTHTFRGAKPELTRRDCRWQELLADFSGNVPAL
jgi:hypothetical protein